MKKIILLLGITLHLTAGAEDCPQWDSKAATRNINQLSADIAHHDERYFNQNAPIISDGEYDALVGRLKQWQACFPAIAIKSSNPRLHQSKFAIDHQAPMGSLKKAGSETEIHRFLSRIQGSEVLLQPKIDGIAVELVYQNGQLTQASTRGDGKTGVDILPHIRAMPLIPKTLSPTDHGEREQVILHGELFARLDKTAPAILQQYATARHLVAGQLNRSEPDMNTVKTFDFFPWHWIDSPFPFDHQSIHALAEMGFPLPLEYTHKIASVPEIKQLLAHYSAIIQPIFLMDGLVIKADSEERREQLDWSGNTPAWAMAWKFAPTTTTSEVQTIAFTIGRTGHITPVVHIKPVVLQNRILSKVSLGSIENLEKLDIAMGDHISIQLKGNAIAVFGNVLFRPDNRVPPKLPDLHRYTPFSCLSMSPGCEQQFIARLVWLTGEQGLDLAAINTAAIQQWVQAGTVQSLVDILQLKPPALRAIGMNPQEIQQYLQSLYRPKSLEQQIRSLSIPGFGRQKALLLAGCISNLRELFSERFVNQCSGLNSKRLSSLQDYINIKEVRKLIGFLAGDAAPTRSVGAG